MTDAIDPRMAAGMTVLDWTSQMTLALDRYGNPGMLLDPEDWRRWAANVNAIIPLPSSDTPDPYQFADWRDWAAVFFNNAQAIL